MPGGTELQVCFVYLFPISTLTMGHNLTQLHRMQLVLGSQNSRYIHMDKAKNTKMDPKWERAHVRRNLRFIHTAKIGRFMLKLYFIFKTRHLCKYP